MAAKKTTEQPDEQPVEAQDERRAERQPDTERAPVRYRLPDGTFVDPDGNPVKD